MSKELDEVVLLGDGILVKKPIISNLTPAGLHLPEGQAEQLLDMYECEVVKTGPGDQKEIPVLVGDIACLVKGPQYAELKFDGVTYFITTQHNILFVKRKNK